MRFEHLIQLNDPLMPLLDVLSREQVWRGLVLRAHDPVFFVMGLERCTIHTKSVDGGIETLTRTLDFGPFQVEDRVTLTHHQQVEVNVAATDKWPRSQAIVRIEEPQPDALFLRFIYEWDDQTEAESELDVQTREIRQQAYVAADLDTVQRIRELSNHSGSVH
jgi:hypothetical protein